MMILWTCWGDPLLAEVKTCLHREKGLHAFRDPDEVTVVEFQLRMRRILVGIDGHGLPPVILQAVVSLQGLHDRQDLDPFLPDRAVNGRMVHLDITSRPPFFRKDYARLGHPPLAVRGYLLQGILVSVFGRFTLERRQVASIP